MRLTVSEENAPLFLRWLAERGGIKVWRSVDLCEPGKSWSTPADAGKSSWQAAPEPERIVTDAADIDVVTEREVKRFRVAARMGSSGTRLKLTDSSAERVRRAVEAAGEGARHVFDYSTQEAVILVPSRVVLLNRWVPPCAWPCLPSVQPRCRPATTPC